MSWHHLAAYISPINSRLQEIKFGAMENNFDSERNGTYLMMYLNQKLVNQEILPNTGEFLPSK